MRREILLALTVLWLCLGTLAADGEVLRHDREIAFCRATVTDQHGCVVARALGTFRYIRRP